MAAPVQARIHAEAARDILQDTPGPTRRIEPGVPIKVRGDSGFVVPAVYAHLDAQHIAYTIALGRNPRLKAMAAFPAEQARAQRTETGEKVRLLSAGEYQADTWEEARRAVLAVSRRESNTGS